jgi:hypothetical protein
VLASGKRNELAAWKQKKRINFCQPLVFPLMYLQAAAKFAAAAEGSFVVSLC